MKKYLLSVMLLVFALAALQATAMPLPAVPFSGLVTFNLSVIQQLSNDVLVSSTTNHPSKTTTNITHVYKSTVTNFTIGNAALLKLLANSFKTTLPAGAQLVTDGYSLYLVDKTGTNQILDLSLVLSLQYGPLAFYANSESDTENYTKSGLTMSFKETFTDTQIPTLMYDDSAQTTADGTHTVFNLSGVATFGGDSNQPGTFENNFSMQGASGTGMIHGKKSILSGSLVGSVKGKGGP